MQLQTKTSRFIWLKWTGIVLLLIWFVWWGLNFTTTIPIMLFGEYSWLPVWPYLGLDFLHNYIGSRSLMAGNDPYKVFHGDPFYNMYTYPPITLLPYLWCHFFPPTMTYLLEMRTRPSVEILYPTGAVLAYTIIMTAIFMWSADFSRRVRIQLGITPLPYAFVAAALLFSTPTLFELERGNCNVISLLFLCVGFWVMHRNGHKWDSLAGLAFAISIWIKLFPAIIVLSLLTCRRYRLIVWMSVWFVIIGLVDYQHTLIFIRYTMGVTASYKAPLVPSLHPMLVLWPMLWDKGPFEFMKQISPYIATLTAVIPFCLLISYRVWKLPRAQAEKLMIPLSFLLIAAGTYIPRISNDYNYFFYILAALALWDKRDPFWVHMIMGLVLLYWQPFALYFSPTAIFWIKLAGVYAMGYSLIVRARELQAGDGTSVPKIASVAANPVTG